MLVARTLHMMWWEWHISLWPSSPNLSLQSNREKKSYINKDTEISVKIPHITCEIRWKPCWEIIPRSDPTTISPHIQSQGVVQWWRGHGKRRNWLLSLWISFPFLPYFYSCLKIPAKSEAYFLLPIFNVY